MHTRMVVLSTLMVSLLLCGAANAWWDTQIQVVQPPPTVRDIQAEDCPGVDARFIADDPTAWGGKAVVLQKDGPTLRFDQKLTPSHYAVFAINKTTAVEHTRPYPPFVMRLTVTNLDTNQARSWRQRVVYTDQWQDAAHLYFSIDTPGTYRIEVAATSETQMPVLVDFLQLKDVFGNLPRRGDKRSQNLYTAAEIAAIRSLPANKKLAERLADGHKQKGLADLSPADKKNWRAKTFNAFWDTLPPRNLHFAPGDAAARRFNEWKLEPGWGPWTFRHHETGKTYARENWERGETAESPTLPDAGAGYYGPPANDKGIPTQANWMGFQLMQRYQAMGTFATTAAEQYLKTGDEITGWQGVCALIAFCELYPDIDFQTQRFLFTGGQFGMNPLGKFRYSGHAWGLAMKLVQAYDHLYPLIHENAQLAELMGKRVAWVKTDRDVVTFMDTHLLQHVRDCVDRQVIRAGDGDSELTAGVAAVVQGPGEAAQWIWELLFTRCHFRMTNRGGIQDHLVSSYNRDGTNYIGSVEYTKASAAVAAEFGALCRRFTEIGGTLAFDLSDTQRYPKVARAPYFGIHRKAAGVWTPRIGDWGMASDPPQTSPQDTSYGPGRSVYLRGWRSTKDPRFAWVLTQIGREAESDAEWQAIEAAAARTDNPWLTNPSRHLPGFGMVMLEANPRQTDWTKKSGAVLRTGVGQGHGHCDQLSLTYYGHGARLLTDNGRRGGNPNSRSTRVHNTVEVDEKSLLTVGYNRTGVGWAEAFAQLDGPVYTSASARAKSHPYLTTYRRDVALVPVGDANSYLVDVFRVGGGTVHTWCCAGPVNSAPEQVTFNTEMSDRKTPVATKYFDGWQFENVIEGACPETLEITWQVDPAALQRYRRNKEATDVFVRAWKPQVAGQTVMRGHAFISGYTGNGTPHNFAYLRNEGEEGLQGAYLTVTEGYEKDRPVIDKVESIPLEGNDALAAKAVRVTRTDGTRDVLYFGNGEAADDLGDGVTARGRFASVSLVDGQPKHLALVGGSKLTAGDVTVEPTTDAFRARVTGVDIENNTVTLDTALPALDGATFLVTRAADHQASFVAEKAEGKTIRWRGSMQVFRSALTHFDEATGRVTTDLPPVLVEASPTYYDNLNVANERGEILGRAEIHVGERFMYLGFPSHMTWRQRLSWGDVVDANGDGKRTLEMISVGASRKWLGDGKTEPVPDGAHMADLEVTRIRDDGLMMWFKDPSEVFTDSLKVPHKGWPYQGMKLVTEDGKKSLQANYPGTEYTVAVKGRKLTQADFPDADGDGKRSLIICDIAPGDTVETPSVVSLTRAADGTWTVRANCPVATRGGRFTKE